MAGLIRILFPFVGYICTATVITLLAAYGYLRSAGMLDDEKMFRMATMIYDIDLEEVSEKYEATADDVPPEETSYQQAIEIGQVARLQLQAKIDDLDKNIRAFNKLQESVNFSINHYNQMKQEIDAYLEKLGNRAKESGLVAVQQQIEKLDPKKQAKPLLVQWIKEERIDDVILLLNGISQRSSRAIIRAFDEPEDVQVLKDIYDRMLSGHPEKTEIEKRLKQLDAFNEDDR